MKVILDNFIGVFEEAFDRGYCASLVNYFDTMQKAGLTKLRGEVDTANKLQKDDESICVDDEFNLLPEQKRVQFFNKVFWDDIYSAYQKRYSILNACEPHTNYAFKVQKTEIGGGYHVWHFENDERAKGSRLLAWILYLNDVDEGGETEFLYYPKRIKPKAGTLILWPAGYTHAHRGNPPISNSKYIVTGWIEF